MTERERRISDRVANIFMRLVTVNSSHPPDCTCGPCHARREALHLMYDLNRAVPFGETAAAPVPCNKCGTDRRLPVPHKGNAPSIFLANGLEGAVVHQPCSPQGPCVAHFHLTVNP